MQTFQLWLCCLCMQDMFSTEWLVATLHCAAGRQILTTSVDLSRTWLSPAHPIFFIHLFLATTTLTLLASRERKQSVLFCPFEPIETYENIKVQLHICIQGIWLYESTIDVSVAFLADLQDFIAKQQGATLGSLAGQECCSVSLLILACSHLQQMDAW